MKESIISLVLGTLFRRADMQGQMLKLSVFEASDVAEEAADDILNLLEERTARYYEQHEPAQI